GQQAQQPEVGTQPPHRDDSTTSAARSRRIPLAIVVANPTATSSNATAGAPIRTGSATSTGVGTGRDASGVSSSSGPIAQATSTPTAIPVATPSPASRPCSVTKARDNVRGALPTVCSTANSPARLAAV